MVRCYLPPVTSEAQIADRALCHTLLECAIPIIYAGRQKTQVVTPDWLAISLSSNRLVNALNSKSGSKKLRKILFAWFLSIPGASSRGLESGSLPSVFHGKYRSIIKDILHALERVPSISQLRVAA